MAGFLLLACLLLWRSSPKGLVSSTELSLDGWLSAARLPDAQHSPRDDDDDDNDE